MNRYWCGDEFSRPPVSRRELLRTAGAGFAGLALAGLLGEESSYITGHELVVDGGLTTLI